MLPPNPFNPGSPVDPNNFVGRVQDLENFTQKLRQTSNGSLASMAVAGGYGIGKTSFLHKCKAIAEEQNALTIYFSLNELDDLNKETLAKMLLERIQAKVREEVIFQRISDKILDTLKRIKITTGGVEISLENEKKEHFPNLHSALTVIWENLKTIKSAIVFLIDEARILEKNRAELILYLRAILEQLQINKVPVMIVPAGKLSITGPAGTGFSPLVRTFPPAILENFSFNESQIFIEKKLSQANINIKEKEILNKIYQTTEGHPFVLTAYLSTAYSKLKDGEQELKMEHFDATDLEFTNRILSPFFSRFYDQSGKNNKSILSKMAVHKAPEVSLSDLTDELNKNSNELSPHLGKLVQEGAIIRTERGKYRLFHHLLGEYIKDKLKSKKS